MQVIVIFVSLTTFGGIQNPKALYRLIFLQYAVVYTTEIHI